MQNKTSNSGCNGAKQGSNCVIWTGQPIPALGIEKGDSMTDITCTIAQQVVKLAAPLDLSTVSIQCLIDNLDVTEPIERTVATMLQIAYDSTCNLEETVQGILAQLANQSAANSLTLNLACLATFDVYGNALAYTEQSVLQTLITTLCSQATTITGLSGNIQSLTASVTALQAIPQYTEPLLSSCLYSGTKTSSALQITAAALCTYQTQVGQITDIQAALAKMPTSFTSTYGLNAGWIVNPTNLAQSYNNTLIVIANLATAITTIQNTCCQLSCSDIVVDFDISLNTARTVATLFFAAKSDVPAGFTEVNPQGDLLTITDGNGAIYTTYVKTLQQINNPNGMVIDLSGTALDTSTDYTFNLTVELTDGTLTCVKCVTHVSTYNDTCAFCTIMVTAPVASSYNNIVVIYNLPGGATQYATIFANQTYVMQDNANVTSLIVNGSANYTSTCTLPQPSQTTCYELDWGISVSSGGNDAVFTDAWLQWISVLGVQYPVSCNIGVTEQAVCYGGAFTNFYPSTIGLMSNLVFSSQKLSGQNFYTFQLTFKTTAGIAASMQAFIGAQGAPGNPNGGLGTFDAFAGGAYIVPIASTSANCTPPQVTQPVQSGT